MSVENKKELEEFFGLAEQTKIIYYNESCFHADRYLIDEKLITEEMYGPFTEKVLSKVKKRNKEVESLRDKICATKLFFLLNGIVHQTLFVKEEYMFSFPIDYFNDLEIEIDGLYDYVHSKKASEAMNQERKKMELFIKLQEQLFQDEIFLQANKGAKMIRMKEIAYEMGINDILMMTKVDLENYSDLMTTKYKLENKEKFQKV
jgi:hypothetical protein